MSTSSSSVGPSDTFSKMISCGCSPSLFRVSARLPSPLGAPVTKSYWNSVEATTTLSAPSGMSGESCWYASMWYEPSYGSEALLHEHLPQAVSYDNADVALKRRHVRLTSR
jgi:hypothetical protein